MKFEYTTLETDSVEVTLQVYKLATLPVEVSFINAPRDFDPSVLVYSLSKKTLNVAGRSPRSTVCPPVGGYHRPFHLCTG